MKTATQPSVISPVIIILALLTAAVVFLSWKGTTLPLLSNPKVSLAIVLLLGMGICAQGGIGRVAAAGQWTHPLSIAGYLLGAAILLLTAAVFLNIELPFIASPQQALVVIAALMAGKIFISLVHYLLDCVYYASSENQPCPSDQSKTRPAMGESCCFLRYTGAMNSSRQLKEPTMKSSLPIILLAIVLLLAPLTTAAAAPAAGGEIDFAALDTAIAGQMRKHGLPGVALAVVEGGEIVYLQGYGAAGRGQPMTPQTPMLIGSQSKSFTALAIAQLAEQGWIDFNAPVRTYIPWFRVADEEASARITVNHLLHHTSGLSDAGYGVVLPTDATPEQAVRSLAHAQLTAPVGSKHQYFNLGYSTLAHIVEIASGQSFADYVQTHILDPLAMASSTADPFTADGLAQGYTRLFGFPVPMREQIPAYGVGEGFIISTAEDMARYAIAVMDGGAGLVSPEMMRRILTPGLGSYGMGWIIVDGGAKIVHGGANQTFRTDVNLYPKAGRAFVLLTNQGHQVDHFVSAAQLTAAVEAVVLGNPSPPVAQGWSVRWMGWALGIFVIALALFHTRNLLSLRGWRERARAMSPGRRAWDVGISFIIPTAILVVVFWQVSAFYGDRFNLWTNLAYFRFGLPDVFILMLIGVIPDFVQGVVKSSWTLKDRRKNKLVPAIEEAPHQEISCTPN